MRLQTPFTVFCALLLAACSAKPVIPVNDRQTLVMEATVLAAGVTADEPRFSSRVIQPIATSRLYNERDSAVKIHYRFYWYDSKGLEMHPLERAREIVIPPRAGVTVASSGNFIGARQVRLSIWL
ncbi:MULTISPECIES: YcfL family protein [Tenebrionibacter/Tenebrionicola group]|jgi:uncharacterized protein YcfL|uniref:YcfL family protein n=2 Tax=Tenebrionibacter/Tenebrionicola group TaxID=2969848 RepID=A0A8K0XWD3_9ENTR|nr:MULTISPECIES: YcfL family protein [Tenebrionibacter/Tenebrionicola group]MBK4715215.1 YcfL family protein [Tenebrionibacter intestinalis]MBV4412057.1 YcfL family protein [Tenebrionicola larvae]MBV5094192.1 YcfL family protein [Tenebrionicola larvae]